MSHPEYITLAQAAQLCPGKPHPSTVWRWARKGVASGGRIVRLRTGRQGRRTVTTPEWLDEFTRESAEQPIREIRVTPAGCDVDAACVEEGI
jgi:hypothetical protein